MEDQAVPSGDLNDVLEEHHILLPSAQLLTGFLTTVPFSDNFNAVLQIEKEIFFAAYLLSVISLVVLSAVAVQHRLLRPLRDREQFKRRAGAQILLGAVFLALSLALVTQVVVAQIVGDVFGYIASGVAIITATVFWGIAPLFWKRQGTV